MHERSLEDHEYKNEITEENIYKIYQLSASRFKNHNHSPVNEKNSNERLVYSYKADVSLILKLKFNKI